MKTVQMIWVGQLIWQSLVLSPIRSDELLKLELSKAWKPPNNQNTSVNYQGKTLAFSFFN